MKIKSILSLITLTAASAASGAGLYLPNSTETPVPLKWSIGLDATWDDNTSPGGAFDGDETFSLNPYVGVSFVSVTPQTTLDVYARLGLIYYLDEPAGGADSEFTQSRVGVDLTHRFTERLRFTSRNFLAFELEPDYSYGYASSRQNTEYLYWQTDNSIGFRWSERFATYTGFQLEGLNYSELDNSDRLTWTLYNQFRYQLSPQSVLTATYRYSQTNGDGLASDSTNQFFLVGFEHRFSPNTVFVVSAGAQLRELDGSNSDSSTNPYVEMALNTQVNTQFSVGAFARYGAEDFDTVVNPKGFNPLYLAEYGQRLTLRVGVSAQYQISEKLSLFSGLDLITSSYEDGRRVSGPLLSAPDLDETLINAYVGASLKFTDNLFGTLTYNFTDSTSDASGRDYDRNRISVGLRAEF